MIKRTLTLIALLTCFSPFLAAQGWFEIVTAVEGTTPPGSSDPDFLTIEVAPGKTIEIRVEGLNFTGIDFAGNVQLEGYFTMGGGRATAIAPGGGLSTEELTGTIVDINLADREVELLGGWVIYVPESAVLKDEDGNPLELCDSEDPACPGTDNFFRNGDFVEAEGEVIAGWFTASELKIVDEFVCPSGATLTHVHAYAEDSYEDGEKFCRQKKGDDRQGRVRITSTDYDDLVEDWYATITVGRYVQDKRHGLWITMSEAGQVERECFYHQGELVDGDERCPE